MKNGPLKFSDPKELAGGLPTRGTIAASSSTIKSMMLAGPLLAAGLALPLKFACQAKYLFSAPLEASLEVKGIETDVVQLAGLPSPRSRAPNSQAEDGLDVGSSFKGMSGAEDGATVATGADGIGGATPGRSRLRHRCWFRHGRLLTAAPGWRRCCRGRRHFLSSQPRTASVATDTDSLQACVGVQGLVLKDDRMCLCSPLSSKQRPVSPVVAPCLWLADGWTVLSMSKADCIGPQNRQTSCIEIYTANVNDICRFQERERWRGN